MRHAIAVDLIRYNVAQIRYMQKFPAELILAW